MQKNETPEKHLADLIPLICWANIAIAAACVFDFYFSDRPWAIDALAILIFLLNGFALWERRQTIKKALRRELDERLRRKS